MSYTDTNTDFIISGLTIHTKTSAIPKACLRVVDGKIAEISSTLDSGNTPKNYNYPSSYQLIPGRIDLHIHGAAGADMMDANFAALDRIRQALAQEGVTGFLATSVTETPQRIEAALQNISKYQQALHSVRACSESPQTSRNSSILEHRSAERVMSNLGDFEQTLKPGAEILGVHLEGPFLSPQHTGAHRRELLLNPQWDLFDHWQKCANGWIKLVTLAPELAQGIDFIRRLRERQVGVSIGHTDADFQTTQNAIAAGAAHATHLFNAMRAFHHRDPGCLGAILLDNSVFAELIVDGHHCHAAAVQIALKLKGKDKLVLVTDAMRGKCCQEDQTFELGGQQVSISQGAARLANGVLAGSVLSMQQAIINMMQQTSVSIRDIIQMTSMNPAKILGLDRRIGSIEPGKDADFVILDEHLAVVLTIAKGRIIYSRDNST